MIGRRVKLGVLLLFALIQIIAAPTPTLPSPVAPSPPHPLTSSPAHLPTPAEVATRLRERFARINDYECVMHTETRAGRKVETAAFRLWYRKPGLLRLRVLQGRHKGSELALGADGVLHGRRGGLLRPFSRRLDRSDPSLRSLRGQPAWELDFGSFLQAMRERMSQPGSSALVSEPEPVQESGEAPPRLVLEVRYRSAPTSRPLRDEWTIIPTEWLLTRGDVFDGDTRVDHIEFSQVRMDRGLKESWFRF